MDPTTNPAPAIASVLQEALEKLQPATLATLVNIGQVYQITPEALAAAKADMQAVIEDDELSMQAREIFSLMLNGMPVQPEEGLEAPPT